jgi:hypothetical protein
MGQRHNSHFFTETALPSIERKHADCHPKLRTTAAHLHADNPTPHPSQMSAEKIKELGFILVPQPAYRPDLAPCDFFPSGHLKHHLEGKQLTREGQVIAALREVFDRILLDTFQNLMDD